MRYKPYLKYKDSVIEWLGKIPAQWITVETKFAYSIQLGKMLQPESDRDDNIETPYLKAQHVQWEKVHISDLPTMWASSGDLAKYSVADGDLLVCEGGAVGRSGIVLDPPEGTIIQNALHRVRGKNENDSRFLMYLTEIAASQGWFEILCNRSTIAHFTGEKFGAMKIALPTPSEQRSIANFLYKETGRIHTLVEKKRQMVELLKEKRTALISRAVTKGLDPNAKMKESGIEWLGKVPEYWDSISLRWLSRRYAGGTPDKSNESYWDEGTIPWINSGAVNQGLITEPSAFITKEAYQNSSAKWIPTGALVIALAGQGKTKGMVAQLAIETTCNQSMAAIVPNEKVACRFLFWWLTKNYPNIRNLAGGEQRDGLNLEMIGSIPCPVFSFEEQRAIADYLDRETSKIDRLIEKVEAAIEKLQEYRTALITAAVTGKIDVRETAK